MITSQTNEAQYRQRSKNNLQIYVRNTAKKAILLSLPKNTSTDLIKQNIEKRMNIDKINQLLFLHGKVIQAEDINLVEKSIFHVVNMKKVNKSQIFIKVKRIEQGSQCYQFNISSTLKIREFMENQLSSLYTNSQDFFLVYTGRELSQEKTFQEEFVEDQSEILCIHKVENLIKNHQTQQTNSRRNIQEKENKKKQADADTEDVFILNEQKYSRISSNNYGEENKNFKKKTRGVVEQEIPPHQSHFLDDNLNGKGYPLPFSVISSRHEEEQSLDYEKNQQEYLDKKQQTILDSNQKSFLKQKSQIQGEGAGKKMKIKIFQEKDEIEYVESEVDKNQQFSENQVVVSFRNKDQSNIEVKQHQLQKQSELKDENMSDEQKDNVQKLQNTSRKKKKSIKSLDSQSLLIDSSQDLNIQETVHVGRYGTNFQVQIKKGEIYSSDILQSPLKKPQSKLSYTFGDKGQISMNSGELIFIGDSQIDKMKSIMDQILEKFDGKYKQTDV